METRGSHNKSLAVLVAAADVVLQTAAQQDKVVKHTASLAAALERLRAATEQSRQAL